MIHPEILYQISELEHCYGEQPALNIPKLTIDRGSIVSLVGPNGSGKTTCLKILALLETPSRGLVIFNGRRLDNRISELRRHVTLLLQDPYLLKRTVFENIGFGLRVRRETNNLRERVYEALAWVGLAPEDFARRAHFELSGGESQRVALAARLVLRPKVLLLDEPTASVDAASALLIKKAALRARDEWGATLVIASHDLPWLYKVSNQVLSLFQGELIGTGPTNLIVGPWERGESRFRLKKLGNGQVLGLPAPAGEASAAVIDPSEVQVHVEAPAAHPLCMQGIVSQMTYEQTSGEVLISVTVEDLSLMARTSIDWIRENALHPGRHVWLVLNPYAVQWR
jgi:tungstate transport system ATP-binding protein